MEKALKQKEGFAAAAVQRALGDSGELGESGEWTAALAALRVAFELEPDSPALREAIAGAERAVEQQTEVRAAESATAAAVALAAGSGSQHLKMIPGDDDLGLAATVLGGEQDVDEPSDQADRVLQPEWTSRAPLARRAGAALVPRALAPAVRTTGSPHLVALSTASQF